MTNHAHHLHIFSADIDNSITWYRDMLGGQVCFDGEFGGARNVFMRIGAGRLHFYDQPPRDDGRGAVHHLGIRTDDLAGLVRRMEARGVSFRTPIREFGSWRYIMCEAPDGLLLELFEIAAGEMPGALADYFADGTV